MLKKFNSNILTGRHWIKVLFIIRKKSDVLTYAGSINLGFEGH